MADVVPDVIPLAAVPSQTLTVTLNAQACKINVFTKHIQVPVYETGSIKTEPPVYSAIDPVFVDLYVNDVLVIGGAPALNNVKIVRDSYLGFVGDLSFTDTQGTEDPQTGGLGARWLFLYWPPS